MTTESLLFKPDANHLYIHVPFCLSKCDYCAFYSVTGHDESVLDRFVSAVAMELSLSGSFGGWKTVYFGGGTPSLLGPRRVRCILDSVGFVNPDCEVTLEVNPETVTRQALQEYREAGVNRVSIGVQSFRNPVLEFLGRIHDSARALAVVEWALEVGFRTSVDLIYGTPGQSVAEWRKDLEQAAGLGHEHLSAYELTYEPQTPLGRKYGGAKKVYSEFFFATHEVLASLGFEGYEVSSFARTLDARSRHNLATWSHLPYLGIGPGAHSFLVSPGTAVRTWNMPDHVAWMTALEGGLEPPRESETLTPAQLLLEHVMLGLRTADGINLAACHRNLGIDLEQVAGRTAHKLAEQGLLIVTPDRWCPTLKGMAIADSLSLALLE